MNECESEEDHFYEVIVTYEGYTEAAHSHDNVKLGSSITLIEHHRKQSETTPLRLMR